MRYPSDEQIASMQAHLHDDRRPWFIGVNTMCLVVGAVAVALRFASRVKVGTRLGLDDWLVGVALILLTGHVVCLLAMIKYGMGQHSLLITERKKFAITALTAQTFYNIGIGMVKLSILSLYGRIFRRTVGWFMPVLYATALFVFLHTTAQCFTYLFQCVPIDSLWKEYATPMRSYCINFQAAIVAFGIVNIVTDWFMLALPVPVVIELKLERRTKWSMCSLFLIGGLVCVVSIVRLFYSKEAESADPSWDYVPLFTISSVELSTGVLAASMPTWRPLFKFLRSEMTFYFSNRTQTDMATPNLNLPYGQTAHIGPGRWTIRGRSKSRSRSRGGLANLKIDHNGMGTGRLGFKDLVGGTMSGLVSKRSETSMSSASTEKILKSEMDIGGTGRTSLDVPIDVDTKPSPASVASEFTSVRPPSRTHSQQRQPPAAHLGHHRTRHAPPLSYRNRTYENSKPDVFEALAGIDGTVNNNPPQRKPSLSRRNSSRNASLDRGRGRMRVVSSDGFGRRVVSVGRGEDLGIHPRTSEDGGSRTGSGRALSGWLGLAAGAEGIVVTRTVSTISGDGGEGEVD